MFFVTFGFILLLMSFVVARLRTPSGGQMEVGAWPWGMRVIAIVMVFGGLIWSCIVIVPAGSRGVLLKFGAVRGTLSEGIHAIFPYVNSVELMEVRTQKEPSEANASSKDLQVVTTSLALNFHVDPSRVGKLYRDVGTDYIHRIVDPAVQESVKMVTARYTAEELIKERQRVKEAVELDITKRLLRYDLIVEPAGLSITNFNFSPEFNNAIEAKQVAQQEAEQQRYVLQRAELERQTLITRARGASQAARLNAAALQVQGGSKVIAREWIEKWDGHVPTVSGGAGGGVIIDINSLLQNR